MGRRLTVVAALVLVLVGRVHAAPSSAQGGSGTRIAVGLVLSNGLLLPIGLGTDEGWMALSVDARDANAIRLTPQVQDVRDGRWRLYRGGRPSTALSVTGETDYGSHCSEGRALTSDFADVVTDPDRRLTNIGLAVLGEAIIEPVVNVAVGPDVAARRVKRLIVSTVQALERNAVADGAEGLPSAAVRARRVVDVTKLYRPVSGGSGWYYFEARKHYAAVGLDTFVRGWLVGSDLVSVQTRIADDEYKEAERADVLGVMRRQFGSTVAAPASDVWVLEAHEYESTSYRLFDTGERRVVASSFGGSC